MRDALAHKGRTALAVATLVVGLVAAGALLDTWALVRRATVETYLGSHPVSATLKVEGLDAGMVAAVRGLPEVAAVRARRVAIASVDAGGGELTAQLFALADFGQRGIGEVEGVGGAWPPADGEVAIEKSSLAFSQAGVGDTLAVRAGTGPRRPLRVSGVAHDVGLAPGWMDHVVYGFVTPKTMALLGLPEAFGELQLVARDANASRDEVRAIAAKARGAIEQRGGRVSEVDVPVPGRHVHAAQMDSLLLTQGAFAAMTLLVCALLVVNMMAAILASQAREIAVMKSLGARWGQVAAMYLAFAAALGLAASALSLPVAVGIGRWYAALRGEMLNFPTAPFAIPAWTLAIQVAVGALLPVAATAALVARACRMPVAAVLRDPGIVAGDDFFVRRSAALGFLPRPLGLALGNALRKRRRMLLTIAALAAGGTVYLAAHNLRAAVLDSVDAMFAWQRYDFVARMAEAQPATALEERAASVPGVERAEAWVALRAQAAPEGSAPGYGFALLGVPPDSAVLKPAMVSGRWLDRSDARVIVVSRELARDLPGDEVELVVSGLRSTWKVAGVIDVPGQPLAYAPRASLAALRGDDRAGLVAVGLAQRAPAGELAAILRVREALEAAGMRVASTTSLREGRHAIEDHLVMVVDFLGAMAWAMIAVGGLGMASTMGLAVLERTREIGVMRALGASHLAILGLVEAEGCVIALLGWAVSLPLSLPVSGALAYAFGQVMFPVPARYLPEAAGAASWLALVLAVALAACAWPALRATRVTAARALAYA